MQYDSKTVLPLISSYLTAEKGKICETNNFTSIYSSEEMIEHLKAISSVQTEKRFALMLYSIDHVIALLYEKDKKQWVIDNHGQIK
ncbi:hypothetical protein [Rickettsiella endosymbiont of Dermanyssus gallinae]|uniref:hypothetical protein n=1 Tax=Rickettsiella endosymbiont of Dermanyssus gallinae TaxID=2856608 RepID=UPI001C5318EE|nr:hypothetical protein [Rickettsiella endosymbiont of Dermanyssus gallinae]